MRKCPVNLYIHIFSCRLTLYIFCCFMPPFNCIYFRYFVYLLIPIYGESRTDIILLLVHIPLTPIYSDYFIFL